MKTAGLATQYAPSFSLVRVHFAAGIVGSVAVAAALVAVAWDLDGHHFQGRFLGVVHLAVLGWFLPIALGALHQLLPVMFEVPLKSERVAWIALALFAVGATGFVGHLSVLKTGPLLPIFAALVASAIWLSAGNLVRSAFANRARVRSLTGGFVLSALGWLLFAATLGFLLALNLSAPIFTANHLVILRAHASAAGLGFFGLLIMGVAFELLEMFLISHGASRTPGWIALGFTNAGLVLLCADSLFGPWSGVSLVGLSFAGIGAVAFAVRVRAIFKLRLRRKLDGSAWMTAGSVAFLLLSVAAAVALFTAPLEPELHQRLVLAFGVLAILGFIGLVVVGQLFKIVPFLVWMHRFSGLVGLKQVPTAAELVNERARALQGGLLGAGVLILSAGLLFSSPVVRVAGALLFFCAMTLGAHHLWRISMRRP